VLKLNDRTRKTPHRVYIGLGSNIDPETNLPRALDLLRDSLDIISHSSAWETPPTSQNNGPDFINAVALANTYLSPDQLRTKILRPIETKLGRVRTYDQNAPRTIDLDILIFDDKILDPQIWRQAHLAIPLAEIELKISHPVSQESLQLIAQKLFEKTPALIRAEVISKSLNKGI